MDKEPLSYDRLIISLKEHGFAWLRDAAEQLECLHTDNEYLKKYPKLYAQVLDHLHSSEGYSDELNIELKARDEEIKRLKIALDNRQ